MITKLLAKLEVKKGVEPIDSWKSLCKDPTTFLKEIADRLVLSQDLDIDKVIVSDNVPSPADRGKLWVKTSWPYALGVMIDGSFRMDYGLSGFPVNTPFLALPSIMEPLKGNVAKLSDTDITNYGLTNTTVGASNRLRYYIFSPLEVTY